MTYIDELLPFRYFCELVCGVLRCGLTQMCDAGVLLIVVMLQTTKSKVGDASVAHLPQRTTVGQKTVFH